MDASKVIWPKRWGMKPADAAPMCCSPARPNCYNTSTVAGPMAPMSAACNSMCAPDVLIVDDFGLKPLHPPSAEDWFDIIAERYEHGSLIITSNRALSEWPDLFGNPILASAGLDRLFHNAHALTITGASFRARTRQLTPPAAPVQQEVPMPQ